jgi:hypothetical protein
MTGKGALRAMIRVMGDEVERLRDENSILKKKTQRYEAQIALYDDMHGDGAWDRLMIGMAVTAAFRSAMEDN